MHKTTINIKHIIILLLIAGFFRFFQLPSHPVSLSIDEIAIAYDSYSIAETSRDQWGQMLPLAFRSIGDYKPPLLVYLMVPAIKLIGLNEFGTRFTIALIGTLTVIPVYLLIQQLTDKKKVSFIAALLVAISPWHIQFSRSTFEAILALFLVITGAYFFVKSSKNKFDQLWISAIFFAASIYAYHAERVFTPIFVLALSLIYFSRIIDNKTNVIRAFVVGLIIIIPLIPVLLGPGGKTRAEASLITRDYELTSKQHSQDENLSISKFILNNNTIIALDFWVERYLGYTDLRFIFQKGVNLTRPDSPDIGLLHLFELPFFLTGLYLLITNKHGLKTRQFRVVIAWLFLGPLAASLANNSQHALRSLTLIPIPQLISALGIYYYYNKLSRSKIKSTIYTISLVLIALVSMIYWHIVYFIQFPNHFSAFWMDGWKEASIYAYQNHDTYSEVIIDPRFGTAGPDTVGIPYLYVLFYNKINPQKFQSDIRRSEASDSVNFENFSFRSINWLEDNEKPEKLYIGSPWALDVPDEMILRRFYIHNGKEIVRAVSP